ncbi:hypothetical protein, partial [Flavobacterium psychrophilum]|nr:hypothetical protein [Flavobacterium psychrophilum]
MTNVTGAGGVNINTSACSSGWEILDNSNTGATSNFNSPDGVVMSMTIKLLNPQDGTNEQLSIGGAYPGVLVAGNASQTLTITNNGTATTNVMRNVLDDLIYKDLAANPNTVVQRQVSVQVVDAVGGVSNAPIAFFSVKRGSNSGNAPGAITVFTSGTTVNLFTGLDGTQDAGGTWVDLGATGALVGNIVNIPTLPLGGSSFRYDVAATSPCGVSSTTVLVIKMSLTELAMTSSTSCGALLTNYTNPLYSANTNDAIYMFNSGVNSGTLECPAGSGVTTYNWYVFNPATNSYSDYALNSTRTQANLANGGYLVVRNDGGVITEGRSWVWNIGSGIPNAGVDAVVCAGDTYSLNGNVGGLTQTFTHYNPVKRPFVITPTTRISVSFTATHAYVSDLAFYLVNPDGTKRITLASNQNRSCNSGDNVNNLTFTNQGAPAYLNYCLGAPSALSGIWNGYFTGLNATDLPNNTNKLINWGPLFGENANQGGWKVQIYDCVTQDSGSLKGATIIFDDGAGNIATYTSGSIDVPINDDSCTAATASIYVVPSSPLVTVAQTLMINPNVGVNGVIGGWQWEYSTASATGPFVNFNNATLTPNLVVNQDTWVQLSVDNNVSSCNKADVMFIKANPKPNAGIGTNLTQAISPPIITLANQLAGENAGGVWTLISGVPGVGAFNAGLGTLNPVLAGVGTYVFRYTVTGIAPCPTDTEDLTIRLTAVINPVTENGTAAATGGTAIPNVAANDVVNGLPATLGAAGNATVATSGVWPSGITLNPATGAINVAVGTIPGVYPVTYQLCDKLTPQTCATIIDQVTVTAVLNPVADSGVTAPSTGGEAIPNVAANDVVNGLPATLGAAGNATIATSGVWPVGVTLNPTTGAINVAVGTIPGVYPVTYQLCDKLTPQTCATVVNTVTVTAVLNPVADSGTAPSTGGEAIPNVALNDVVNGLPATLGVSGNATIATSGVWPVG